MTTGASLFLIALGAILTFAVNATVSGLEISTIGLILMAVGAVGLALSLLLLRERPALRREEVVAEPVVVRARGLLGGSGFPRRRTAPPAVPTRRSPVVPR